MVNNEVVVFLEGLPDVIEFGFSNSFVSSYVEGVSNCAVFFAFISNYEVVRSLRGEIKVKIPKEDIKLIERLIEMEKQGWEGFDNTEISELLREELISTIISSKLSLED